MSSLTARIRIARISGGKYIVEKIGIAEDLGERVEVTRVPIEEEREFPNKQEARKHGEKLAHKFVTRKHREGATYSIDCRTRVRIPPEVLQKVKAQ